MMKFQRLERKFYNRPTLKVAKDLLGKFLVFRDRIGMITETEAYIGRVDPASHSYRGVTPRTKVMFGPPGFSYVYFIYGMYYCFNIVTEKEGEGAAVLIRAVEPVSGIRPDTVCNGPGKLCKAFGMTKEQNEIDLTKAQDFYVEDRGIEVATKDIQVTKRIGLSVAKEKDWRFVLRRT